MRYLDTYQITISWLGNWIMAITISDNYLGGFTILRESYHDETSFWRPCVVGAQAAPSTKCTEEEAGSHGDDLPSIFGH